MTAIFNQAPTLAPATLHGKKLILLAHLGPALLTVFFIWLPFGFALTGLLEEWGLLGYSAESVCFF